MRNSCYINYFWIFFLISASFLNAQFTLNSYNNGWIQVNGSTGVTVKNLVQIQMQMQGQTEYKNWSIVTRIVSPILNGEKKEFPVNKLKLKFNNYRTEQYYNENYPTTAQLGVIQSDVTMNFSPVYLIKNSPLTINTNGRYGSIILSYDVIIEGGNYLNALKSWNNYNMRFEISLLNQAGNIISTGTFPIDMQISPNGNYPNVPAFTISVDGSATNGELVFSTMNDYVNGVRKEYQDGLNISSDTPYEIQVSSQSPYLKTSSSDNLDLNSVRIQLKDSQTNRLSNEIKLSNYNQTLISSSTSTTAKKYTIIYSTAASDQKIMNSKPGTYSTTLLYTISPL